MSNDLVKSTGELKNKESKKNYNSLHKKTFWLPCLIVIIIVAIGVTGYLLWNKESGTIPIEVSPALPTVGDTEPVEELVGVGELAPSSHDPGLAQYLLLPVMCCIVMLLMTVSFLAVISKVKLTKKEDPTKKFLKELREKMMGWVSTINLVRMEAVKDDDRLSNIFRTIGTNDEKLKNLAEAIDKERNRIPPEW